MTHSLSYLQWEVEISGQWEIIPKKISLNRIRLFTSIDDPFNLRGEQDVDILLSGELEVCGIKVDILFSLTSGQIHCQLENLELKSFLYKLTDGKVDLPSDAPEIYINYGAMTLNFHESELELLIDNSVNIPKLPFFDLDLEASLKGIMTLNFSKLSQLKLRSRLRGELFTETCAFGTDLSFDSKRI